MKRIVWTLTPLSSPTVERHCSRCGKSRFYQSGQFRVNAQQKRLDIWLIWRCEKCDRTWNMDVLTRVNPRDIPPELYKSYQDNDAGQAFACAWDPALHRLNKVTPCIDDVAFDIQGTCFSLPTDEALEVAILPTYPLPIKLTQVLARKLALSGSAVQRLFDEGTIRLSGSENPARVRMAQPVCLYAGPPAPDNE